MSTSISPGHEIAPDSLSINTFKKLSSLPQSLKTPLFA